MFFISILYTTSVRGRKNQPPDYDENYRCARKVCGPYKSRKEAEKDLLDKGWEKNKYQQHLGGEFSRSSQGFHKLAWILPSSQLTKVL